MVFYCCGRGAGDGCLFACGLVFLGLFVCRVFVVVWRYLCVEEFFVGDGFLFLTMPSGADPSCYSPTFPWHLAFFPMQNAISTSVC